MYRYGDGTPFPLDENFIETLTSAVEACTGAFMPLTELDVRRDRARAARGDADREIARLSELDKTLQSALGPFMVPDKGVQTSEVAKRVIQTAKAAIQQARGVVDGRVQALEAQAGAGTAADAVLHALRPFFDQHQLPNARWIYSWDARSGEPRAEAVATAGRLSASFRCTAENHRTAIRVGDLAENVIVHMMKKGLLGKAKPSPVDLSKYVMVSFEKTSNENVITLKERGDKPSQGLRFMVNEHGANWQSVAISGEADTDPNPLDFEDVEGIRRLGESAARTLRDVINARTLTSLALGGNSLDLLPEPRIVPMELLQQLTPLCRTIRERSRVSGELVLKRDIGGGRREELFVPRAALAQQFSKLPMEYRKPFEDMGISSEDTQPAISLPQQLRPPAKPSQPPPSVAGGSIGGVPSAPPHAQTIRVNPPTESDAESTLVKKP